MNNLFVKLSILGLLCVFASACSTQRNFTTTKAQSEYTSGTAHRANSHFFISGLGQTDRIDAVKICGKEEKIQAVETKQTFPNILVGIVTLGIYTPMQHTVYCK